MFYTSCHRPTINLSHLSGLETASEKNKNFKHNIDGGNHIQQYLM